MMVSLIGCGKKDEEEEKYVINYDGKPNITANADTKWIDSEIYGAIDDNLEISIKDDFFTAINKEWLLEQTRPTAEVDDISLLMEGTDIVKQRLIDIVSGNQDPEAFDCPQVDIDSSEIEHDQELVVRFVEAVGDWEARNAAGVEPLRKYIEDIDSITSINDLTEFIADLENRNISQESFISIFTHAGEIDAQNYRCIVQPHESYVLNKSSAYTNMGFADHEEMRLTDEVIVDVLSKLGYSEEYAKKTLTDCYQLEGQLIDHTNQTLLARADIYDKSYTLKELIDISGNYPFERIYQAYGYTDSDNIRIADKAYLKYLGKIFTQSNLEKLKAYFIVHSINHNILLLGRDYYDKITEEQEKYSLENLDADNQDASDEQKVQDEWDLILNKYAIPKLGGPLNVVYISRYCSEEQKSDLVQMVNDIKTNYHKMIDDEDWMSDTAKEATHEKLDFMTARVLYPDKMESFLELQFDEDDDLLSMVQKIDLFDIKRIANRANQPVDRALWDLGTNPTTIVNAFYKPDDNSINIMAGIISGKNVFNVDSSYEVNLARFGTIIGHEISHAFDLQGCTYDKYGYNNAWWDMDDMTAFQMRVNKMSNYYSGIVPYPGARNLMGIKFTGEAIADMGGMNVSLMIARDKVNFDYDLFFKSYAELWRVSRSLGAESGYADEDVHPLNYLRTNITLSQFDEFIETYDIKPGDGMYCAPEDRIKVW